MEIIRKKIQSILLPPYVIKCLKQIPWIKKYETGKEEEDGIEFHPDDMILITYGTRGSTPFSGPDCLRYGGNTTSYQVYSPKLPDNVLYLGDGGSGILEIDKAIIRKCFAQGINPFTDGKEKVAKVISEIINTYTHYHYDHLHTGAPLAGLFHADVVRKLIIGGGGPRKVFQNVFKRPIFPRDFSEMEASYAFYEIKDARSSVIAFLPGGDFRELGSSEFKNLLKQNMPQIKHKKISYNLHDCLIVKCFPTDHPDPCISYRYENYDKNNKVVTAITFMTDYDIRDTDYRANYFKDHVKGSDAMYIDGQYEEKNYIPGFGHGRVELVGAMARELKIPHIAIGHHDPTREDRQIDAMIELAKKSSKGGEVESKIFGASDRMMIFAPGKARGRTGIVIGKMDFDLGGKITNDVGSSVEVRGNYIYHDLTVSCEPHEPTS